MHGQEYGPQVVGVREDDGCCVAVANISCEAKEGY
jgi:hypothetical protein